MQELRDKYISAIAEAEDEAALESVRLAARCWQKRRSLS